MSMFGILVKVLGKPLGAFLLKKWLGEIPAGVGKELIGIAATRLSKHEDQRKAARQFDEIGDKIVARLAPLFEHDARNSRISVEAVAHQLELTLEAGLDAQFVLDAKLEPAQLGDLIRKARPLPHAQLGEPEVSLYNRALDLTVRCLVEVAATLPKFELAVVKTQLRQVQGLQDKIEDGLKGIGRIEARLGALDPRTDYARYEADYRAAVKRELDFLELFGAELTPESKRHKLSIAYISLSLDAARKGSKGGIFPAEMVLDGLDGGGRLLIRGEAGSGKSTLFRWAAMRAAGMAFEDEERRAALKERRFTEVEPDDASETEETPPRWRNLIPFLIRFRDCEKGKLPKIESLAGSTVSKIRTPPDGWVDSVLSDGRAIVLIDGLDEVPQKWREAEVFKQIKALVEAYEDCYYIVSTRPSAVEKEWLKPIGFREAQLAPMSRTDQDRFVDKWHKAVAEQLAEVGRPAEELEAMATALKAEFRRVPAIARLATNPLMAAMICALHRDRRYRLPDRQSELVSVLCHILLDLRERESDLPLEELPEAYRLLSYEQKKIIVEDLAAHMLLNGVSSLPVRTAQEMIGKALDRTPGHKASEAEIVLQNLVERSGLLRESKPGHIDFIHNAFKEFLAAECFVGQDCHGLLAKSVGDEAWDQVLLYAGASTQRRDFASKLIKKILPAEASAGKKKTKKKTARRSKRAVKEEGKHAQRLMAVRLGAVAQQLEPDLDERLEMIRESLLPPRTMADAEALAECGDAVVGFLRDVPKAVNRAAASVRTLRLIGSEAADDALEAYLDEEREAVLNELAQAVNPLRLAAVQKQLLENGSMFLSWWNQITDVSPLSSLIALKTLDLRGTQVRDVSPLSGLTALQTLSLARTQVTDVSPLSSLTALRTLRLWRTQVTDVSPLSGLTALQWLNIHTTQVTDVSPLSGLTALQTLYLSGTQVTDVSPLSGLTALQTLYLSGTQVADVSPLSGLTALQSLKLASTQITDVSPLSGLTALQSLYLDGTQVTDVSPLSGLTALQTLYLDGTQVTDVSPLSGLIALQELSLAGCTGITDAALEQLDGCKRLTELYTDGTQITKAAKKRFLATRERD